MPDTDPVGSGDPKSDRSEKDHVLFDHFFQLVMMDERTRKVWKRSRSEPNLPDRNAREHLSQERNKILQQRALKKRTKN